MIKKNSIFNIFIFSGLLLLSSCADNVDPELLKDLDEEIIKDVDIDKALKKLTKDMTFGEALICGYYYHHKKDSDMMVKCYERALTVGGKQALMKRVTMELAEAYLTLKDYEKAKKHANVYVTLYPGDQGAKRAAFIEINANYLATYTADRDQQKTDETIKLIYAFQDNYGSDEEYTEKVAEILTNSYSKIIDSELNIAETYVKRYNHFKNFSALNAAQKRIKHIKINLLPKMNTESKRLNDLELFVDKNMRFELSKMIIDEAPLSFNKESNPDDISSSPTQDSSTENSLTQDNKPADPLVIDEPV